MNLTQAPTRNLLFTGKGGVGKTSIACAIAVSLAEGGKRVLLVSTDPASNLDEVLGNTPGNTAYSDCQDDGSSCHECRPRRGRTPLP